MLSPVELRHKLHQSPELMFREFETTRLLYDNVSRLENIKIHKPLETGFVAEYTVNPGGEYLLFRADIDALPIKEETGAEFASKNNYMHACGHDVHTSILYGFLNYVASNNINQNILFLFQPGEEGGGGAEKVINSGIFNNFKISKAFALHVTDEYDAGTIASTKGVLFASAFEADIIIQGKSAHVAFPWNGINAFNGLRKFLDKIEAVLANEKGIIFCPGKIESGVVRNIIPAYAKAECTFRTLSRKTSEKFFGTIISTLESVKKEMNIEFEVIKGSLYTEVVVDENLFDKFSKTLSLHHNFIDCGYKMTGEDFGFISKLYPSFMFWLGTSNGERHGLHNAKFLPDDSTIDLGINVFKDILAEEINGR